MMLPLLFVLLEATSFPSTSPVSVPTPPPAPACYDRQTRYDVGAHYDENTIPIKPTQ
jgi:hypothetical protein